MPITIVTTPAYPVVDAEITLTATGTAGTATRWELTSVPDESALETGVLYESDGTTYASTFTPDVSGAYGVRVYDVYDFVGIPSFGGDPLGESRQVVAATATATIYVGQALTLPIVTLDGHGADLRLVVLNDHVRAATLVDPRSELSRVACLASNVTTPLAALVGVDVDDLGPTMTTAAADFRTQYEAHRVKTSGTPPTHAPAGAMPDNTNVVQIEAAGSLRGAIALLNDCRVRLDGHLRAEASGGTWHGVDDETNVPVVAKASDAASGIVLLADLRRSYEAHRVLLSSVHGTADTVNTLAATTVLESLITAFLSELISQSPTTPTGEQSGAAKLAHRYGLREDT